MQPPCDRRCGLSVVGNCMGKGVFNFEGMGFEQDILLVGQLQLLNIPIQEWIIDPDVHGLLDGPWDIVGLPTHYGEVVHNDMMSCGIDMVIDGGRGLRCSLSLSPKVLADFLIYSLITIHSVTLLPVDYCTFPCDVVPVHGGHQEVLTVLPPLKWTWIPTLPQMFLKLLLKPLA